MKSFRRFLSTSVFARRQRVSPGLQKWWPESREKIFALPEYNDALRSCHKGKITEALHSLRRGREICSSVFGEDHRITAAIIADIIDLNYEIGRNANDEVVALVEQLMSLKIVREDTDSKKLLRLRLSWLKLCCEQGKIIQAINEMNDWNEGFMNDSTEFQSLRVLLLCLNPERTSEDLIDNDSEMSKSHARIIEGCMETESYLVLSRYLHNISACLKQTKAYQNQEYPAALLHNSLEALERYDSRIKIILSTEVNELQKICQDLDNSLLLHHCALTLYLLGLEEAEQQMNHSTRALKIAEKLVSGESSEFNSTMALILGGIGRTMHLNSQAVASEGLYTNAIEMLSGIKKPRPSYKKTLADILENYALLLEQWEKREHEAQDVKRRAELTREEAITPFGCEYLIDVRNWSLADYWLN